MNAVFHCCMARPGLLGAIDRVLAAFRRKDDWTNLMKNAMARDYSWSRSARAYAALYKRLCVSTEIADKAIQK